MHGHLENSGAQNPNMHSGPHQNKGKPPVALASKPSTHLTLSH